MPRRSGGDAASFRRLGSVCLHVDSLLGLVIELLRSNAPDEAMKRLRTRRGMMRRGDEAAFPLPCDRDTLQRDLRLAGFVDIALHGLGVGDTALGRQGLTRAMQADMPAAMGRERFLAAEKVMADAGLRILAIERKPAS